jgi:hypothetical protein
MLARHTTGIPRIVSLLPSATELVVAAGGAHMLVGRSHECDFPADVKRLPALTSANNAFESSAQVGISSTSLSSPHPRFVLLFTQSCEMH